MREHVGDIAGCHIRLMRGGQGPALLYLHDARGVAGWLPFLRRLAEQFDVLVPDHPGFGRSDTPSWLARVSDLGRYYADFVDALDLSGVHVVGASLGGWIAVELALRRPDRVASLSLIAPAGLDVPGLPRGDIFGWSPEEKMRNLFANARLAEVLLSFPVSEAERRRIARNDETAWRIAGAPSLHDPDMPAMLVRVTRPTQLIWGDTDRVIPSAYGVAFRDLISGASLRIVECCGHLPQVEHPDTTAALIAEFAAVPSA